MTRQMHDHDRGLEFDLATLRSRRGALALFGGAGLAVLTGCATTQTGGSGATTPTTTGGSSTSAADGGGGGAVEEIPQETGGPFPGDGSNGPNVLTESGIVRGDIRASFGPASGVATGVPLTIKLTVLDAASDTAIAGAAVYLWHCDIDGRYSLYSQGVTNENYLRGVQAADASGALSFTSIFPGAYAGRWPHIHFEVYPSLAEATKAGNKLTTSQLALPEDACAAAYATDGYAQSVRNLAQTSLRTDNVFRDGWDRQLATVTGDASSGYVATLAIGV